MRLSGPQSCNCNDDCHDCRWRHTSYRFPRYHHQWHVLDDDDISGNRWLWHWRGVSCLEYLGLRGCQRIHPKEARPNIHLGNKPSAFLWWTPRRQCLPNRFLCGNLQAPVDGVASLLRHRLSLAFDSFLLQNQDVELKALSQRSHQETGPVSLGIEVLLEVFDRDLRSLVSVRLCMLVSGVPCRDITLTFVAGDLSKRGILRYDHLECGEERKHSKDRGMAASPWEHRHSWCPYWGMAMRPIRPKEHHDARL